MVVLFFSLILLLENLVKKFLLTYPKFDPLAVLFSFIIFLYIKIATNYLIWKFQVSITVRTLCCLVILLRDKICNIRLTLSIMDRGYYRCTHRHSQGCLATKQVQRSDQDPTILEVACKGMHTCTQGTNTSPKTSIDQEPNMAENRQQNQAQLLDFQTKDLDTPETFQPLNTNPSPSSSRINPQDDVFSAAMMDTNIYSPSFMSSEPHFFSYLPSLMEGDHGSSSNMRTSESNAQNIGIDFPFGQLDLHSNFPFDNPKYFPWSSDISRERERINLSYIKQFSSLILS